MDKTPAQYRSEVRGYRAEIDAAIQFIGGVGITDAKPMLESIHDLATRLETTRAEFARVWPGAYAGNQS